MKLNPMSGMLKQVQKMQEKMRENPRQAENKFVTEESGGGMVRISTQRQTAGYKNSDRKRSCYPR